VRLVGVGEVERRRQAELAVLRRRAVAVGVVVALLVALGVLLGRSGGAPAIPSAAAGMGADSADSAAAPLPVADRAYVVQAGDTLWKIARALQPDGDVRPLVSALQRTRHGAPLRVGERVSLP
jgi:nucleoid-associated protein YgaU